MAYGTPDKPAKVRGATSTMTINTSADVPDGSFVAIGSLVASSENVPVQLKIISPAEAFRLGRSVDETIYRVRCPVRNAAGGDIRIAHNQCATIDGVEYQFIGPGNPQGSSGYQHAIAKKVAK